jgi:hypothetical protein
MVAAMAIKIPSKPKLRLAGITNPWGLCVLGGGRVYIDHRSAGTCISAAWMVYGVKGGTDPKGPWYNYGNKSFSSYGDKGKALAEAKEWATEKYGTLDWVRDPFGAWQDARVVARAVEKLKAGVKDNA